MPNPHPFATPYADRDEAALLSAQQQYVPLELADAAEVGNTDLSLQFAGIKLRSTGATYHRDADDTQANDGENVIYSEDGMHWLKDTVSVVLAERTVTGAGAIAGLASDVIVLVDKATGEDTDYNAVASADFVGDELTLKDLRGDATAHRLRFVPNGTEKVDGQDYFDITRDHGWVTVRPKTGGGWYVRNSSE